MKKRVIIAATCLALAMLVAGGYLFVSHSYAKPVPLELTYYYIPTCENCTDGEGFAAYLAELLGPYLPEDSYTIELKNVADEENLEEFKDAAADQVEDGSYANPPMLVIGEHKLLGLANIEENVRQTAIDAYNEQATESQLRAELAAADDPDESVLVYFYKNDCPYCEDVFDYFRSMDDIVQLEDGTVSSVRIICINIGDVKTMPIADDFYRAYSVPESEWKAPMVFWRGGYLYGHEDIRANIQRVVLSGEATGWTGVPE